MAGDTDVEIPQHSIRALYVHINVEHVKGSVQDPDDILAPKDSSGLIVSLSELSQGCS